MGFQKCKSYQLSLSCKKQKHVDKILNCISKKELNTNMSDSNLNTNNNLNNDNTEELPTYPLTQVE